jgi:hypothetical protein
MRVAINRVLVEERTRLNLSIVLRARSVPIICREKAILYLGIIIVFR